MTSISSLRQIVLDMHAVAPDGLRKVARAELAENIVQPLPDKENQFNGYIFTKSGLHRFKYPKELFPDVSDYLSKIYDKEQNMLNNKTIKALGISIENKIYPGEDMPTSMTFNVLQGLNVSKNAGFTLPKNIVWKKMKKCAGYYDVREPQNLYINPYQDNYYRTVIHETVHKNDKFIDTRKVSVTDIFSLIMQDIIVSLNTGLISREIGPKAAKSRNEFVADTAEKLLVKNKTWSDFDPKIKKLYDMFEGPKFKTWEPKEIPIY